MAVFEQAGKALVMNNLTEAASTTLTGRTSGLEGDGEIRELQLDLEPMESRWIDLA